MHHVTYILYQAQYPFYCHIVPKSFPFHDKNMVNVTYPHALVVRDKRSDWDLSAGDLAICVYKGRGVLVDKIAE